MVQFKKHKLTEREVAGQFVLVVMKGVRERWPEIAKQLKELFSEESSIFTNQSAPVEFSLAVVASQIQALPNLLPSDQANRIRDYILKCVSSSELEEYPREAIQEYQNAWDRSLKKAEPPFYGIASVLYDKLGCQSITKQGNEKFKSPLLLMALSEKVVTFGGPWWKNAILENEIVP